MTREEAKNLLIHILMTYEPKDQYGDLDDPEPYEQAVTMAIEALSDHSGEVTEMVDLIRREDVIEVRMGAHLSAEPKTGKWIDKGNWMGIECSRCNCHSRYVTPFCPQCGATMRSKDERSRR